MTTRAWHCYELSRPPIYSEFVTSAPRALGPIYTSYVSQTEAARPPKHINNNSKKKSNLQLHVPFSVDDPGDPCKSNLGFGV